MYIMIFAIDHLKQLNFIFNNLTIMLNDIEMY